MKTTLLYCFIALSFGVFSQDKVILRDGRSKSVEILTVNQEEGKLEYQKNSKTSSYELSDVVEYKKDNVWYSKNFETNTFEQVKETQYLHYSTLFRSGPKFEYSKYSVSLGYGWNPQSDRYNNGLRTYFFVNPRIRIEPEMRLKNWLSVKMPIVIGLNPNSKPNNSTSLEGYNYDYGYYNSPGAQELHFGILYGYQSYNNDVLPSTGYSYSNFYRKEDLHTKDLIYQIGASAKFYPLGLDRWAAFYLSPSLNYGLLNYNAVDYYANFIQEEIIPFNGDPFNSWRLVSEDLVSRRNEVGYFRMEFLLGVNFNFTKTINLALESGFSSREYIISDQLEDRTYLVANGGDPVLLSSQTFTPQNYGDMLSGFIINRIHLVVKLGGKKYNR